MKTPLMFAAWRKHYKCVEALIAFQANPDLKDIHGGTFFVIFLVEVANHCCAGFTAIGHSHKDDFMSVKLLWKWKLQHWKNEIRLKKMLRSMSRLNGNKLALSPSASPKHSPHSSPHHSPTTSPASSPRRSSLVRKEAS
jgi:hypothetical protein